LPANIAIILKKMCSKKTRIHKADTLPMLRYFATYLLDPSDQ